MNYHYINFIPFKVSNYSSLKDVTPLTLNDNVVHYLKGSCDKTQSYIGKTKNTFCSEGIRTYQFM